MIYIDIYIYIQICRYIDGQINRQIDRQKYIYIYIYIYIYHQLQEFPQAQLAICCFTSLVIYIYQVEDDIAALIGQAHFCIGIPLDLKLKAIILIICICNIINEHIHKLRYIIAHNVIMYLQKIHLQYDIRELILGKSYFSVVIVVIVLQERDR